MRYVLTDERWSALEPLVRQAKTHRGGPQPPLSERLFFEALSYLGRTGVPPRDLPSEFGAWDAVYNRLRRWVFSGAMRRPFEAPAADPALGEVRRVPVDATTARAHRGAAGARRRQKRSGPAAAPSRRAWAAAGAG
jgi:putative transposase